MTAKKTRVRARHWYDFLWIWCIAFFALGSFNIMFAWLGMLDFTIPLLFAVIGGNKWFCNNMCGRGQLLDLMGTKLKLSCNKPTPRWMGAPWFRYGFMVFFLAMFANMVFQTYLVAAGVGSLTEAIKLLWTIQIPWDWAYSAGAVPDWVAQFSFGFYGLMLTALVLGLVVMVLFKPRSWCVFCPMGTMTQLVCRVRNASALREMSRKEAEHR